MATSEDFRGTEICNAVVDGKKPVLCLQEFNSEKEEALKYSKDDCIHNDVLESLINHAPFRNNVLNTLSNCDLYKYDVASDGTKGSAQRTHFSLRTKPKSKVHFTHLSKILNNLNQQPQLCVHAILPTNFQRFQNDNVRRLSENQNVQQNVEGVKATSQYVDAEKMLADDKNLDITRKNDSNDSEDEISAIFKTRSFSVCPSKASKNRPTIPKEEHKMEKESNKPKVVSCTRNISNDKITVRQKRHNSFSNYHLNQAKKVKISKISKIRKPKSNIHISSTKPNTTHVNRRETQQKNDNLTGKSTKVNDVTDWFKLDTIHRATAKRLGQLMSYTPEQAKFVNSYSSLVNKTGCILQAAVQQQEVYKPEDVNDMKYTNVSKSSSELLYDIITEGFPPAAQLVSNDVSEVYGSPYGISVKKLNETDDQSYFGNLKQPLEENSSTTQKSFPPANAGIYHMNETSYANNDNATHQEKLTIQHVNNLMNGSETVIKTLKKPCRVSSSVAGTQIARGTALTIEQHRMIERVNREQQQHRYNTYSPSASLPPAAPCAARAVRPSSSSGGLSRTLHAPDRRHHFLNENSYGTLSNEKDLQNQIFLSSHTAENPGIHIRDTSLIHLTSNKVDDMYNDIVIANNRLKYDNILASDRYNRRWAKIREDLHKRKAANRNTSCAPSDTFVPAQSKLSTILSPLTAVFSKETKSKSQVIKPKNTEESNASRKISYRQVIKTENPEESDASRKNNNKHVKKLPSGEYIAMDKIPIQTGEPLNVKLNLDRKRHLVYPEMPVETSKPEVDNSSRNNNTRYVRKLPSGEYVAIDRSPISSRIGKPLNVKLNFDREKPGSTEMPVETEVDKPVNPNSKYVRMLPSGAYVHTKWYTPPIQPAQPFNVQRNPDRNQLEVTDYPSMPKGPAPQKMDKWRSSLKFGSIFSSKVATSQIEKSVAEGALKRINYPKSFSEKMALVQSGRSSFPIPAPSMPHDIDNYD